jgi:hypothetical protein
LAQTRVQAGLSAPGENAAATKELLTELLRLPEPLRRVAEIVEGAPPGWAPDLATTGPVKGSVRAALRRGRALLIDGSDDRAFGVLAGPWADRVDVVDGRDGPIGMLIRPDGYLAWAANDHSKDAISTLHTALTRWFGPADQPTR